MPPYYSVQIGCRGSASSSAGCGLLAAVQAPLHSLAITLTTALSKRTQSGTLHPVATTISFYIRAQLPNVQTALRPRRSARLAEQPLGGTASCSRNC